MYNLINEFGNQIREALEIASKATLRKASLPITNVVVAGMGGSAIGASLCQAFTYDSLKVPLTPLRAYEAPGYLSPNTLYVAASYSGNTEETLKSLETAIAKGAHIVAISSGGKLTQLASEHDFDLIKIPGDANCPRASIGYAFVQLLKILNHHGLTPTDFASELSVSAQLIESEKENIHSASKELAKRLKDKLPIFYIEQKFDSVALRAQQQINENSKQFAHMNSFPEMNHNELVGWALPADLLKRFEVVYLHTDFDHVRTRYRMEVCKPIFEEKGASVTEVKAVGKTLVEQLIYLIHYVDWVSFYLASENNVEPFPIEVINYLKSSLAKLG